MTAVEFEGQVSGTSKAVNLPRQMVGGLRVGSERVGQRKKYSVSGVIGKVQGLVGLRSN